MSQHTSSKRNQSDISSDTRQTKSSLKKRVTETKNTLTETQNTLTDERNIIQGTIMAIHWRNKRLGCAYYFPSVYTMYLMEDEPETEPYDLTDQLIDQISPQVLLLVTDVCSLFNSVISRYENINVEKRAYKDFDAKYARQRLLNWQIQNCNQQNDMESHSKSESFSSGNDNRSAAYLRLSGIIHLESYITAFQFSLSISFRVFFKQTLYSIKCRDSKASWIKQHKAISYFIHPDKVDLVKELRGYLKHMKNVNRLLADIREHQATSEEWQQLLRFVYYGIRIHGALQHQSTNTLPIMTKIRDTMNTFILKRVGTDINDTIDFEKSAVENRVVVKSKVNRELDGLKEKYQTLDDFLVRKFILLVRTY
ncbi:hypothetical protein BDF14DRAFT_1925224 [Spinellus fusiger]|nr:hypothetical protein BDF14DRAFT_1925224 [Spinellus fusiger]